MTHKRSKKIPSLQNECLLQHFDLDRTKCLGLEQNNNLLPYIMDTMCEHTYDSTRIHTSIQNNNIHINNEYFKICTHCYQHQYQKMLPLHLLLLHLPYLHRLCRLHLMIFCQEQFQLRAYHDHDTRHQHPSEVGIVRLFSLWIEPSINKCKQGQ